MANGERCKHCGKQETEHAHPELGVETCGNFETSAEHHPDCPGAVFGATIMCDGDCEATIAAAENEAAYYARCVDPSALYFFIMHTRAGCAMDPGYYFGDV